MTPYTAVKNNGRDLNIKQDPQGRALKERSIMAGDRAKQLLFGKDGVSEPQAEEDSFPLMVSQEQR